MKSLRDELHDIIYIHEMPAEHLNKALEELLQVFKRRDRYVVGEDEEYIDTAMEINGFTIADLRNEARAEIRQRQQQTLGEAEDWTTNPI